MRTFEGQARHFRRAYTVAFHRIVRALGIVRLVEWMAGKLS